MKPAGSRLAIAVFGAIGLAILLVAVCNFVNLTTARSSQRYSEVGLRLSLGARRTQVIMQFMGESLLLILMAVVSAVAMVELLLPVLRGFLGSDFAYFGRIDSLNLGTLLFVVVSLAVLAGWYPAMVMAKLKPARALRNQVGSGARGFALKNVLVVLQFTIAITLIIAAVTIYSQMHFARSMELGFHSDRMLVLRSNEAGSRSRIRLLKQELLRHQGIGAATLSSSTPEQNPGNTFVARRGDETRHPYAFHRVDYDYFSVFDIRFLAGRTFMESRPSDLVRAGGENGDAASGSYVLNQKGAGDFGWSPDEAVGQLLINNDGNTYRVIGVVSNTIESALEEVKPAIYAIPADVTPGAFLTLRLSGTDLAATLEAIDRTWRRINPDEPIMRSFLDDNINALYQAEDKQLRLSLLFSLIAIVISCMGLFALASFNAERRTKEIGVRKVMGGSVWSIVLLLTNDFSRLVLIANVIAWPLAYVAMDRWLQNFAYRVDLGPMIFIGRGLIALCVAWMTVGGTAAKVAGARPVLALRYE